MAARPMYLVGSPTPISALSRIFGALLGFDDILSVSAANVSANAFGEINNADASKPAWPILDTKFLRDVKSASFLTVRTPESKSFCFFLYTFRIHVNYYRMVILHSNFRHLIAIFTVKLYSFLNPITNRGSMLKSRKQSGFRNDLLHCTAGICYLPPTRVSNA